MMNFVKKPNLPSGRVNAVICGTNDDIILTYFRSKGIKVIKTAPNPDVDSSVSSHADMTALHIGNECIIVDKCQRELKKELVQIGMTVYETAVGISGAYPDDVKLNFALIGENVVGNLKYADKNLAYLISEKHSINVKQGYAKCSMLVLRENAIITDDESIHRKMRENGIDSLLIRKGDVSLPGHEYGFIGGASGKTGENEVLFFGDIRNHRDYEAVKAFLFKNNCTYACTDKGELRDIGGIIPITEDV